ncbi:polyadenylate-binding protein RBP47-like [Olea europaea var. sylvestris]|uniref:polyadenylate-binding protein RBP47-like n=1 Tax=Olea europaea var. sylvestris TaxID=158386 RepID=UPI000C1D86AB|nr:polyadenylate-binding protein RBP47-like [Olea europaea var. sylvestris]
MNSGDSNQQHHMQQQQHQHQHQQWIAMQQYQQQWMAMHYPAMAMQQMIYNHHYVPYYHQQQQYQQQQIQSSTDDNKTIWIGDLQQWMDETYLQLSARQGGVVLCEAATLKLFAGLKGLQMSVVDQVRGASIQCIFSECFCLFGCLKWVSSSSSPPPSACVPASAPTPPADCDYDCEASLTNCCVTSSSEYNVCVIILYMPLFQVNNSTRQTSISNHDHQAIHVVSVKVICNKHNGQLDRYGFVEFSSHAAAEKVLRGYSDCLMPNTDQTFRLNWTAFSSGDRRTDGGSDLSIFVGDLDSEVTDALLHETFASKYPSVKGAKVVVDSNTDRSKCYGFVRFGDENERSRAMMEMNGVYCTSRPMRISIATPKKQATQQQYSSQGGYTSNDITPQGYKFENDSSNTTIFVGGLDSDVTDEELRQSFTPFGEVVSVKIPAGKGRGFVQFLNR